MVDSASIEVNRRAKRVKTDRLDVGKLLNMLIRYDSGEEKLWSVVNVPSVEEEDMRHLHRQLCKFKVRRTRHRSRIEAVLVSKGVRVAIHTDFLEKLEGVGDKVLRQARAAGVAMGGIQVVDSVHTVADVDKDADRKRQEKGKGSRDPQAQVVRKGKRGVTGPDGKRRVQEIRHLGYKSHVSLNAETGLITTIYPTGGSAADNKQFPKLLAHDEALGVNAQIYTGDRAYDDTDLHYRLWESDKFSAFSLNDHRTNKKDDTKEVWQRVVNSPQYQAGLGQRYKVERKFGEAKRWHGFGRCRYLGLVSYGIQAHLTALALNLKRIVYLLTGVTGRARSPKAQVAAI